jgi:hypothetical protein
MQNRCKDVGVTRWDIWIRQGEGHESGDSKSQKGEEDPRLPVPSSMYLHPGHCANEARHNSSTDDCSNCKHRHRYLNSAWVKWGCVVADAHGDRQDQEIDGAHGPRSLQTCACVFFPVHTNANDVWVINQSVTGTAPKNPCIALSEGPFHLPVSLF